MTHILIPIALTILIVFWFGTNARGQRGDFAALAVAGWIGGGAVCVAFVWLSYFTALYWIS